MDHREPKPDLNDTAGTDGHSGLDRCAPTPINCAIIIDYDADEPFSALRDLFGTAGAGVRVLVASGRHVPGTPDGDHVTADPWAPNSLAELAAAGYSHAAFVRHRFITPVHVRDLLDRLMSGQDSVLALIPGVNEFLTVGYAALVAHDLTRGAATKDASPPMAVGDLALLPESEPRRLTAPLSVTDALNRDGAGGYTVVPSVGDLALQEQFFVDDIHRHFPLPVNISLVLSNQCNLTCVMCPFHSAESVRTRRTDYFDHKTWMPLELVEKLVAELKAAARQHVPFSFHMGELDEPLMHPQIVEIVQLLTSIPDAIVHITSNATFLTEERSRRLIDAGVQSVSFSVDAHTQETYKEIRGAKLAKTQRNVETFLRLRQEINPGLTANLCIIDQRSASAEIEPFKNFWRERGASSVSVYQLFSPEPGSIYWNPISRVYEEKVRVPCRAVWEQIFLYPGGEVSLCCTTLVRVPQDGLVSMGNLNESSLRDIWQGTPYQQVRRDLIHGNFADRPYCRDCGIWLKTYQFESILREGTRRIYSETMEYFFYPDHNFEAIAKDMVDGIRANRIKGIWGIGSDFTRMAQLNPDLPEALVASGVVLFDREHAGRTFHGLPILPSTEIASLNGHICLTPASAESRESMRRFASKAGIPADNLLDPYPMRKAKVLRSDAVEDSGDAR